MTRARIAETDSGIQGELNVALYDEMQRRLRDKGWIETRGILSFGITGGLVLEVGPGPGYLGLEWLKSTKGTTLKGLDISPDMIVLANRNAKSYGLSHRAEYLRGSGESMTFEDESFDAVFTAGSLHEWNKPNETLNEIWRVTKKGGKVFISDLRRDMFFLAKWFLWFNSRPKEIRPGLRTSIDASYTQKEARDLIKVTRLSNCAVSQDPIGLKIMGTK